MKFTYYCSDDHYACDIVMYVHLKYSRMSVLRFIQARLLLWLDLLVEGSPLL